MSGGPITWRNVNGNNGYLAASRILTNAGNQFNQSFDVLGKALQGAQAQRQGVQDRLVESNTDAFLDRLNSFQNPDDLLAAQTDLEAQRTGYGDNIDRDSTRDAFASALSRLQGRANTQREFEQGEALAAAQPLYDQLKAAEINGNEARIAELSTPENMAILGAANLTDDLALFRYNRGQEALTRADAQEAREARQLNAARDEADYQQRQSYETSFNNFLADEQQYWTDLGEAQGGKVDSLTAVWKDAYQGLEQARTAGKWKPQQFNDALATLSASFEARTGMRPEDAEAHDTQLRTLTQQYSDNIHVNTANLTADQRLESVNDTISQYEKSAETQLSSQVRSQLQEYVTNGVPLPDGSRVPMAPNQIPALLNSDKSYRFESSALQDAAVDLVTSTANAEAYQGYLEWEQATTALSEEFQTRVGVNGLRAARGAGQERQSVNPTFPDIVATPAPQVAPPTAQPTNQEIVSALLPGSRVETAVPQTVSGLYSQVRAGREKEAQSLYDQYKQGPTSMSQANLKRLLDLADDVDADINTFELRKQIYALRQRNN